MDGHVARRGAGDLRQTYVIMKNEVLKFVRGRRMQIYILLLAVVLSLLTAVPYLFEGHGLSGDPEKVIVSYLSFAPTLVLMAATLFASVSIVSEYEERTALLLFTRPVRKSSIFAGKFLAAMGISVLMIGIYYAATALVSLAASGGLDGNMAVSFGLSVVYAFATSGIAVLISSLMKKASTSTILTFVALLLILPVISQVLAASGVDTSWMLDRASESICTVLPGYREMMNQLIYSLTGMTVVSEPDAAMDAAVMAGWGAATALASFLLFRRREF